jgi:transcriptional regulator with GAF, ATPase, and Fis domain
VPDSHSPAAVAELFADLALGLHAAPSLHETVETVVQSALSMIGCDAAGVMLAGSAGRPVVGAVTDWRVEDLYRWQLETGAGPMLDVLAGGHTVQVPDVAMATDWPRWRTLAVAHDFGSVLHVPMSSRRRIEGVLSVYDAKPHAFSDPDSQPVAHILARHATVAVATSQRTENLARAVDARKLVGQAMGILMERYDLDADRAFKVLQRYSQSTNTKLRDVAQQLIDTRRLPS